MRIMNNMPVDTDPFKDIYPFRSNFFNNRGFNYHYVDEGNGDPVLMLHGNPTWSFYFRRIIQKLSGTYRCIAPDHVGCGLSDKPGTRDYGYRLKDRVEDLSRFIDHLSLDRKITLIVHDWGGMIGMAYALANMEKISRIVVTNTAGFFPPGGKNLPKRLWLLKYISPFAVLGILGFNLFSRAALYMAPKAPLPPKVKRGLTAPYNSWKNRIATLKFVQDIPMEKDAPSRGLVERVDRNLKELASIPMLILWGKHDFVFNESYYDEWRKRFPLAEHHLFSDAGHYLFEDKPDAAGDLILDFFKNNPA